MTKPEKTAAFTGAFPLQVRYADTSNTFNPETREVDVVASTGAAVTRTRMEGWDMVRYEEELVISEKAIDLSRLNDGAAVLDSHDAYGGIGSSLGVVQRAWIEDGKLMANIRLHAEGVSIAADALAGMIRGGTAPKISIGYVLNQVRVVEPQNKKELERWVVERWTPFEVSFVTVPADAGAGVRSADQTYPCEFNRALMPNSEEMTMTDNVVEKTSTGGEPVENRASAPEVNVQKVLKDERDRVSGIRQLATMHKLPSEMVDGAIDDGIKLDAFRVSVLQHIATVQERTPIVSATSRPSGDDPAVKRAAMVDAMTARILRKAPEGEYARAYMEHGFADMAADLLGDTRRLTASRRDDVMHRAFHTTSDFPSLLENVANKVLQPRYEAAAPTYRNLSTTRTFTDFKPHSMVRPGDFPNLLQVGETGEIKAGTVSESKEAVSLVTYARQIRISRNVLVNDDLGAIQDILGSIGQRIADLENAIFWSLFLSNPTLATDNTAVWASGHGNLAASGAAISDTTIGAGWAAMMKQTSLDGIKLNVMPRYLVVGPDQLTSALKATTVITNPTSTSNANVQGAQLVPIADANITGNQWYMMADPSRAACFVHGYLEGAAGPQIRTDEPFGINGMTMQVVLDFGVGAIDYRGAYKNAGQN